MEKKTREQIKYVYVCVLESGTEREKAKNRNRTKKGRQKVGERCQFMRQRERYHNCVHKTISSTSLLFEPF